MLFSTTQPRLMVVYRPARNALAQIPVSRAHGESIALSLTFTNHVKGFLSINGGLQECTCSYAADLNGRVHDLPVSNTFCMITARMLRAKYANGGHDKRCYYDH
jgi:hypothetical protein